MALHQEFAALLRLGTMKEYVHLVTLPVRRVLQLNATHVLMIQFQLMVCAVAIKDTISHQELVISVDLTA